MTPDDTPLYTDRVSGGFFIGKAVPWNLLKLAMRGRKGAICVYLACWCLYSMTRRRKVTLKRSFLDNSGLSSSTITVGIDECVRLGLVEEVVRQPGKSPILYIRKESEVYDGL
jgi:hypothetical protein